MSARLEQRDVQSFLERFIRFEDGVITGVRLHLPRVPIGDRTASVEIQAMDASANEWRLVRLIVKGVSEYQFVSSAKYSYTVLSDGLNLDCSSGRCVVDLDPGPDEWLPQNIAQGGEYSKQYLVGLYCEYDVLDGPLI
ncbi:hypothetical protein PSH03_005205 [Micromonospora sp. PSH03]|uniref:hypothetical protein n=1 Tax=Micromonospora TaxID=1873 RepID=UPI001B385704|nr:MULTISPECIES: hypothetical protein [Micromonospora]MBQ0994207.1 hypothetical protein [Micromonospora sp. H61]MCG5459427.1 hypothetical protein [Micromonospora salmantinae]